MDYGCSESKFSLSLCCRKGSPCSTQAKGMYPRPAGLRRVKFPCTRDPLRKTVLPLALLGNGHGLCGAAWPASKLAALAPLAAKVIFNTILEQSLSFPSTLRAYCNVPPVPHGKACLED